MTNIPDDVASIIVQYLSYHEVLVNFQPVCKVWYRCAQESVFAVKIKPYNSAIQLLKLLSLLGERFPNLHRISDKAMLMRCIRWKYTNS